MTQQEPSPAQDQPGAAVGPRPDRTDQLGDTEAHLHFLESLDRVQRVMHGANDLEQEIGDVLGEVLSIFGSDRAWLVYPCDPVSTTWRSVVERTVPAFPPALPSEVDIPMTPEVAADFLRARMTDGAICLGPNTEPPLDEGASRYGIRSQMTMALYPAADRPYVFGIHQCSEGRSWNAHEQRLFVEIGRRISDGLNRLLILSRLRASEGQLAEAQRIAHVGHGECDLVTGRVNWSDETYRIFGHEPGTIELTAAAWTDMIHPDDRARREDAVQAAIRTGAPYEVEYRLVHPSGALRTVACAGNVRAADDGTPLRTFGVIQDITDRRHVERELRRSEARFRVFADHATDAFFLHDHGGRILDVNRQACESLGYSRDARVGQLPSLLGDGFGHLALGGLRELRHVEPGAEGSTGTGDDDAHHALIVHAGCDRPQELADHRIRQRIEPIGAVERDHRHGGLDVETDELAHDRPGSRGRPSTRSPRMLCWISSVPPAMRRPGALHRKSLQANVFHSPESATIAGPSS